jgi:hypothetical protein
MRAPPPSPSEPMPNTLRDLSNWPHMLQPVIATHGVAAVWAAGLRTLGYPPTWITGHTEAMPLLAALGTH